jgi:hypothetical protein
MFYSPILFSQIADLNLTQFHSCEINIDELNKKDKIIIFSLHSMGYLNILTPYLDLFQVPFVLVSAMEDTQLPLEIDTEFMTKITGNKYCKHWFSINKTIPNDTFFTSIPYGLNYWTFSTVQTMDEYIRQDNELKQIIINQQPFMQRKKQIYANFHLNHTDDRHDGMRRKLPFIIPKEIIYYQPEYLPRIETWKNICNYSFVVSPFGHGFDCIRTFEALSLGCIVIMKKSFLNVIYEDLPILIVDEWTDINESLLNATIESFSNKTFNYEKLTMKYWISLVNSKW